MALSLQNACRIPVLVFVSNFPAMKNQIFSSSTDLLKIATVYDKWKYDLQNVLSEILQNYNIVIRETIPKHLLHFIGIEMLRFAEFLHSCFEIPLKFTQHFIKGSYFKSNGLLDEEKAVRDLCVEPSLNISLKNKIYCHYFFRDEAQRLWSQSHNKLLSIKSPTFNPQLCENYPAFEMDMVIDTNPEGAVVMWSKYFEEIHNLSNSESQFEGMSNDFMVRVFSYGIAKGNLAAIKLSVVPDSIHKICEITQVDEKVQNIFATYMLRTSIFFETCKLTRDMLLSKEFILHRDIIMHICSAIEKESKASFLNRYKIVYGFLKCILIWPYQDFFISSAISLFHVLNEEHFYLLLHHILDMVDDTDFNQAYNYRLLLKDFWIQSPSDYKEYVLGVETGEEDFDFPVVKPHCIIGNIPLTGYLLQKIIFLKNFSSSDEHNFQLILEGATLKEKLDIIYCQRNETVSEILYRGNFKLAQFFTKSLLPNEHLLKKDVIQFLTLDFLSVYGTHYEHYKVLDQFIKGIFSPDEADNLKEELFSHCFEKPSVVYSLLQSKNFIDHFKKVCKWFGKTDEEITEWIKNGAFDEILAKVIPRIALNQYPTLNILGEYFKRNIFILCSKSTKRLGAYINNIKIYCKDFLEQKKCVICMNNNHVHFDDEESMYCCEIHGDIRDKIFLTSEAVEEIFSHLSNHFLPFLSKNKRRKLS